MSKQEKKTVLVSANCPKCQKVVQAEKANAVPGSSHSVRFICQECKGSWVVATGGTFDPSKL